MHANVIETLVDEPAITRPGHTAIVAGSSRLSHAALAELTNRIGNALLGAGCAAGDRVLLALPDSPELAAALCAVIKIGALAVPVGAGALVDDYACWLRDLGVRAVIGSPQAIDDVLAADRGAEVMLLSAGDPHERWPASRVLAWRQCLEAASPTLAAHPASPEDPALILHTSGSTGRRKAVVHAHRAIRAVARNLGDVFGLGPADRVLCTARLSFAFGFGFGLAIPWGAGATTILHSSRDLRELARLLTAERPTVLCAVPSLLDVLLRAGTSWLTLDLSTLRAIVSAGEPLPQAVYDGYREHFGVEVLDGMGSTEMLTHFISNRPGASTPGACGVPVNGCQVQLVDDEGMPVRDGEIGNLRVSSDTALLGFWNDPEATARIKTAHGVATGDKLYRDASGCYHFCGRSDDMLKVAGMWVSPGDVEAALRGHPDVEQCAVTAREDRAGRRRLVAYVVPKSAATLPAETLYRHAGDRLPHHMIPAAFVAVPTLPQTPNGKLKRSDLPEPSWTAARAGVA